MNEVKSPKRPIIFYYAIALLILLVFNSVVMPWLVGQRIQEVDYGTFMTMTEEKQIDTVEIQSNQILFTSKEDNGITYKTGLMEDPNLVDRLHEAGATFASDIAQQMSPLTSFLLT